ncbi:uncharacterized protein LOC100573581 [Acyrthosiphon pisum]|uniref:Uncharacterized protein n=1 Tax=Acyrthosiphon pisum TaxID=7029 RepID=A0A8R2A9M1_ACYPI|nr:uncharacterized protein LOC100573581 [Acyrthosiphon pisum]|eukprot:XP_003246746.1 PREDICTED: uncharacterized protein LOC100573581 [Acyrthosiphon pisum]
MSVYALMCLLFIIGECLAYYNSQWMPSFYLGTYPERFHTLRMSRGSCIVSLNTFRSKHYNVEIPLINGSTPAGFCAILLNSMENSSLAISIEQGLTDVNNSLMNQSIRLFRVKNGNLKLIQDVCGSTDVPGLTLAESNTAILLIKADQSINFSLSVYTYQSLNINM